LLAQSDMAEEEQQIRKEVIIEKVSTGSGRQNLPVILFVVALVAVIVVLIFTRFT
jgi:hypothetical protein